VTQCKQYIDYAMPSTGFR